MTLQLPEAGSRYRLAHDDSIVVFMQQHRDPNVWESRHSVEKGDIFLLVSVDPMYLPVNHLTEDMDEWHQMAYRSILWCEILLGEQTFYRDDIPLAAFSGVPDEDLWFKKVEK